MTRAFDGFDELALMCSARSGDPLGDDLSLFIDEPAQFFLIFVVDVDLFAIAEFARPSFPRRRFPHGEAGTRGFHLSVWHAGPFCSHVVVIVRLHCR